MNSFKDPNWVPPGGYRYQQPESGLQFHENYWVNLVNKVRAHRIANQYPLGLNWEQQLIDYNCEANPEWCADTQGPTLAGMVKSFTFAMIDWVKSGMRVVTPEQYQARLESCNGCTEYRGGGSPAENYNTRCSRCGCSVVKLSLGSSVCPIGRWDAIK